MNTSIRTQLVIAFLVIGIVPLLLAGYVNLQNTQFALEKEVAAHLETATQSRSISINQWLEIRKQSTTIITQDPAVQAVLTQDPAGPEYERDRERLTERLLEILETDEEMLGLTVVDAQGRQAATTNRHGERDSEKIIRTIQSGETLASTLHFSNTYDQPYLDIITPIYDKNDRPIGALVADLALTRLYSILADKSGLGETGEAYLVNEQKYMISPSRFYEGVFMTQKVDTLNAQRCLEDNAPEASEQATAPHAGHEAIAVFPDYRNVEVIGTHRYMPKAEWCLLVEIDTSESFAIFNETANFRLLFIALIFVLIALFALAYAQYLSRPLKQLKENVDQITRGNLDIQLEKSSIMEVQSLTEALNRVLASMKLAILRTGMSKEEIGLGEAIHAKKEAEEKYRVLYESARDAIMTLEPPEWKFTSGNPATLEMFGAKTEEEFTNKTPADLSPKRQPNGKLSSKMAKQMIQKAMKEGSHFFKWTHKRLNGQTFPATVLLTRTRFEDKDALQATVRDVSKKKAREKKNTRLKNARKKRKARKRAKK